MWLAIRTNLLLCAYFLLASPLVHGQGVAWQQAIQRSEHLQEDRKLTEAKQVLLDVLQTEALPGAEGLAYIYNNLGSVCQDQGRFPDANRYYRRSVMEWERAGVLHRMALATTLNNLASLLWETGKRREAEWVLVRSSNIQIGVVRPNRPEAAQLLYNLGAIHFGQKRWAEAEVAYRQLLAI